MQQKELEACCRYWQERLNLISWQISIKFARFEKLAQLTGGNLVSFCYGMIRPSPQYMKAEVLILAPCDKHVVDDSQLGDPYDIEKILVHELRHLLALPYEPQGDDFIQDAFEYELNLVSNLLVDLDRSARRRKQAWD